jgi:hypothetical protein
MLRAEIQSYGRFGLRQIRHAYCRHSTKSELARRCLLADQADDDHGNAYSADDARDLADRIRAAGSFDRGIMPIIARKNRPAATSSPTPTMVKRQFHFRL